MMPLPDDIVGKDVEQWLSDGWFYVESPTGTFKIARMHGGTNNGMAGIQLLDEECIAVKFSSMFAHWPVCGALNLPELKYAVYLTRLQRKQWKRTYNSYCLRLRPVSDAASHFSVNPDTPAVIRAAFVPVYSTYTEAMNLYFPDGWKSVAINPSLCVMKVPNQQLVFLNGEISGVIDDKTRRFTCIYPGIKRKLLPSFDYQVE